MILFLEISIQNIKTHWLKICSFLSQNCEKRGSRMGKLSKLGKENGGKRWIFLVNMAWFDRVQFSVGKFNIFGVFGNSAKLCEFRAYGCDVVVQSMRYLMTRLSIIWISGKDPKGSYPSCFHFFFLSILCINNGIVDIFTRFLFYYSSRNAWRKGMQRKTNKTKEQERVDSLESCVSFNILFSLKRIAVQWSKCIEYIV